LSKLKWSQRKYTKPSFSRIPFERVQGIQDLIKAVSELSAEILAEIEVTILEMVHKAVLLDLVQQHNLSSNFRFMGSTANLSEQNCKYDYMFNQHIWNVLVYQF
jgi:hypothetical protein